MGAGNTHKDTDLDIVRRLDDGRRPYREIAAELSLAENTVRNRVERMKEDGLLTITALVDPSRLPGHSVAFLGIKLATIDPETTTKELTSIRGVVTASLVAGRYDAILTVMLSGDYGLLQLYKELDHVKGLQSTETFIVISSDSLVLPYVL